MKINEFIEELKKINIEPTNEQLEQLEKYYDMLIEYNKVMNLTGITEKDQVYLKHFYDSLTIAKVIDLNKEKKLCDIGTGAGFPGIIIKIIYPELEVTLVDSLNKRINFLKEVIEKLKLKKIIAIHDRAEDFARKNIEKYDVVTSRAVAPLNILLEYSIPLLKIDKYFIAYKANVEEEIKNSTNALKKLESEIEKTEIFSLPVENSTRTILKIKKKNKTQKKYPRTNIEIKNKPL
jgi:16S rRNA (guanine527-N7)-methyltransferase